ncbi:MAG: NUDIX hydrolase [Treponema sp.]|jgi:8-oxo-dGTP pyrophosphatase MutT (NUDIX family)|nr:NUDIX hydrolase [Treponema sp.]
METEYKNLVWTEEKSREIFRCPVFSIDEVLSLSPDKESKTFTVMNAPDWVMVIPVLDTPRGRRFVMVRQWRHGARELSLEFPGGVLEPGENPAEGAKRELLEETGYMAEDLLKIGEFNPNPAIMSNRIHFFAAKNPEKTGEQDLDDDEFVKVESVSAQDVFHKLGSPPYIHALIGSALVLYMQSSASERGYTPDNLQ